jgi:hypothetical protein
MVTPAKDATDKVESDFKEMRKDVDSSLDKQMVDTCKHFEKLDPCMVEKAEDATEKTTKSFRDMVNEIGGKIFPALLDFVGGDFREAMDGIKEFADSARKAIDALKGAISGIGGIDIGGILGPITNIPIIGDIIDAGGDVIDEIVGFIGGLFHQGGSFTVGGNPGIDSNVVAFRATAGERVTVTPDDEPQVGQESIVLELASLRSDMARRDRQMMMLINTLANRGRQAAA